MREVFVASRIFGNKRSIWIQPPRIESQCADVVILLDGEFYIERVKAPEIVSHLLDESRIRDAWYVYVSHFSLDARWVELPCNDRFNDFLVSECFPLVEEVIGKTLESFNRTLIGLSYSGLAAAYFVYRNPFYFQSMVSQSGSFWWNDRKRHTASIPVVLAPIRTAR